MALFLPTCPECQQLFAPEDESPCAVGQCDGTIPPSPLAVLMLDATEQVLWEAEQARMQDSIRRRLQRLSLKQEDR